jgi:hypothetical protein
MSAKYQEISLDNFFFNLKQILKSSDINEEITSDIVLEIVLRVFVKTKKCDCSNIECLKEWLKKTRLNKDEDIIHCPGHNKDGIKCHSIDEEINQCKNCKRRICGNCCQFSVNGYESEFSYLNDDYDDSPLCYDCRK